MKKGWVLLLTLTVLHVFSGVPNADLITIGTANYLGSDYNLIYEDDQKLVWLDYTKGIDTWGMQVNWASGLGGSLTVSLNPLVITDIDWSTGWRLPSTDESKANLTGPWSTDVGNGTGWGWGGPDASGYHDYWHGSNMVHSEMGYLYYKSLGNLGYYATDGTSPQDGWGLNKTGDFNNLQPVDYWSGTEVSFQPTISAWDFHFNGGSLSTGPKSVNLYALAVRPGEVSVVPEPATMLLLGSGLIGLARFRRKMATRGRS